jgi:hypothetical protein
MKKGKKKIALINTILIMLLIIMSGLIFYTWTLNIEQQKQIDTLLITRNDILNKFESYQKTHQDDCIRYINETYVSEVYNLVWEQQKPYLGQCYKDMSEAINREYECKSALVNCENRR